MPTPATPSPVFVLDARGVGDRPTGIARSTMTLCRGLAELGTPVRVLSGSETPPAWLGDPGQLVFVACPGKPGPFSLDRGEPKRALRSLRPDVVVSPETFAPMVGFGRWASVPIVHDLIPITHRAGALPSVKARLSPVWGAWVRRQCARAARVMTPSEHSKGELVRTLGVDAGKIDVVPNAVLRATEPSEAAIERGLRLIDAHPADPMLLFVGRRPSYKNAAMLVEAFAGASLPERAKLVFAGPRDPRHAHAERTAAAVARPGSVVFPEAVDDETLAALYAIAWAVACPSRAEGFGLPPLEAGVRTTAVLASDIPAHREVLGPDAPLLDPGDVDAWRVAIELVLTDSEHRRTLATSLRARTEQFTPRRQAEAALACWERALSSRRC